MFGFLRFPSGLAAHLHLSWLDPHKERRFTVVGSRRMATFDDMDLERKVTVYDKGFDQPAGNWGEYITRSGDIWSPSVPTASRCGSSASTSSRACARAARRSRTAAPACASCACSRRCRSGWTPRAGSSVQPSDRAPGPAARRRRADRRGRALRRLRRRPSRHGDRRRLRDPGRRDPRQAAEARAPLVGARARRRRRSCCAPARSSARARSCFAGADVGEGAILGDQSFVRERARIGAGSVIGRGSAVDNDVVVGARVRVQTDVYLTAFSEIEDDVFVGPGVCTTNDDTMSRHGPEYALRGARLRRACRVGGGAVLCPGVEVGEEAFVAAGAVVTRDVPAARGGDGRAGARGARGRPRRTSSSAGASVRP